MADETVTNTDLPPAEPVAAEPAPAKRGRPAAAPAAEPVAAAPAAATMPVHVIRDVFDLEGNRIRAVADRAGNVPEGAETWDCPADLLKTFVNAGAVKLA